jgi:hypothetical protein
MADEYVADAQQYSCRERRDVAEVEQNGTALEFEVYTDTGVTPNAIQELCVKDRLHLCSLAGVGYAAASAGRCLSVETVRAAEKRPTASWVGKWPIQAGPRILSF